MFLLNSVDPDVVKFRSACANDAVILTSAQVNALDEMVKKLKSAGIWAKLRAIYPIIGGSSASHKYNLKDPRNVDAAYRLVFVGSPTHSANGIAWNGTTQYAETYFNASTTLTQNDISLSYYSRTNSGGQEVEMGIYNSSATSGAYISPNFLGESYQAMNAVEYFAYGGLGTASQGFFQGSRIVGTQELHKRYNEAVRTDVVASSGTALVNNTMLLGAFKVNTVASSFSAKQCAFASIGFGLTSAQLDSYYTAVQLYQTRLGRQV